MVSFLASARASATSVLVPVAAAFSVLAAPRLRSWAALASFTHTSLSLPFLSSHISLATS
ncbi:hypothetical protein D3C85_1705880 [compost metagenome]